MKKKLFFLKKKLAFIFEYGIKYLVVVNAGIAQG